MDLERVRDGIDQALAAWLDERLVCAPGEIAEPIRHAVLAPGKRIRPLLVIASWEAAGGRLDALPERALYRLACGPELVHAYSLIHDDLPCMDDDDLRRGRPTAHVKFGVSAAIYAGAALMPLAVRTVVDATAELGLSQELASRIIITLTAASGGGGMVGGQLLDLRAEGVAIGAAELERIHAGKTARLIAASCAIGALAAAPSEATVERLTRYGEALGLAFQSVDDILDRTGSTHRMGKTGGRDEELGKATTPSVFGLEGARSRAKRLGAEALEQLEPLGHTNGLESLARLVLERDR